MSSYYNADKVISQEDINNMVIRFVAHLEKDSWGHTVRINGLPKNFYFKALEALLPDGAKKSFKAMASAVGVAYLLDHEDVTESDALTAIDVRTVGAQQVLPGANEVSWDADAPGWSGQSS